MSNTFTKNFQDNSALTETALDTALQTLKPSLSNLSLATQGSSSYQILRSNGSNTAPVWSDINVIMANTTISSTTANKIANSITALSSTTANNIFNSTSISTGTSVTSLDIGLSDAITSISTSSLSFTDFPPLEVSITTSGRPVEITLVGASSVAAISVTGVSAGTDVGGEFQIVRDSSTVLSLFPLFIEVGSITTGEILTHTVPSSMIYAIDDVVAGTYTYKIQGRITTADTSSTAISGSKLMVREL